MKLDMDRPKCPINIQLLLLTVLCPLPNNNDRIGYH